MSRPRVLLFCHDGMGLGHLRRISRLAETLQESSSTLVMCGMREATWITPLSCGLCVIPNWDGLDRRRSDRSGVHPWLDLTTKQTSTFRARLIAQITEVYQPDVIIVDYLPFGQQRELDHLWKSYSSLRYLLHRGVVDTSDAHQLTGHATVEIAEVYDRILVAADRSIVDVQEGLPLSEQAVNKLTYVGFIGPKPGELQADRKPVIVCSGGSGYPAEPLMLKCIEVAKHHPELAFMIILGPKSRLRKSSLIISKNCQVFETREDLPLLHASARVVVTSGGYNTMLEAALGGAYIVVSPKHTGTDDEQASFADRMASVFPVLRIKDLAELDLAIVQSWQASSSRDTKLVRVAENGAQRIAEIMALDLLHACSSPS